MKKKTKTHKKEQKDSKITEKVKSIMHMEALGCSSVNHKGNLLPYSRRRSNPLERP